MVRRAGAIAVVVTFATAACTTLHPVPTSELPKLNGFREEKPSLLQSIGSIGRPAPYRVLDTRGRSHDFDEDTRLVLKLGPQRIEQRYREITVVDGTFSGITKSHGQPVSVPLASIDAAGVREFSPGKTIGLTVLIVAVALVGLVIVGAVVGDGKGGGGGGFDD